MSKNIIVRLKEAHSKILVRACEELNRIVRLIGSSDERRNPNEIMRSLDDIEKDISDHFKYEEKEIFPLVKDADREIINELLQDHKLIIERIKVLKFVLRDSKKIKENIMEIEERIKGHTKREELIISSTLEKG